MGISTWWYRGSDMDTERTLEQQAGRTLTELSIDGNKGFKASDANACSIYVAKGGDVITWSIQTMNPAMLPGSVLHHRATRPAQSGACELTLARHRIEFFADPVAGPTMTTRRANRIWQLGRRRNLRSRRPATSSTAGRRPARLSRDSIVNAALTFLDREGWDALTINALATQLGTKGPSLYNHVHSLDDLRRTVRMRVIGDIIEMLNTVGQGRTRDDAVMAMASAYRSYAHHHPGRYSAFTRMPFGGDDPEFTRRPPGRRPARSSRCWRPTGLKARTPSTRHWSSGRRCTGSSCWR